MMVYRPAKEVPGEKSRKGAPGEPGRGAVGRDVEVSAPQLGQRRSPSRRETEQAGHCTLESPAIRLSWFEKR
jgi:hypothetical protein